jgi:hypothetical protein
VNYFPITAPIAAINHRKLRIAWSVAWGIMAVLLVALWVRSYRSRDAILGWLPIPLYFQVDSDRGAIHLILNQEVATTQIKVETTGAMGIAVPWAIRLYRNPRFGWWFNVATPHWSLFLLSTILAASPWIRQSPWRFSLRTLLIATTLVAVVLGLIVWATR